MKIVTEKMKREIKKAVDIIYNVNGEIKKRERANGLKIGYGNPLGLALDSILEDLEYYFEPDDNEN